MSDKALPQVAFDIKCLLLVWGKSGGFCTREVFAFRQVNDAESTVAVEFTPTIPHCSMATLIGLSIKVKLIRSLPERFKVSNRMTLGGKRVQLSLKGGVGSAN